MKSLLLGCGTNRVKKIKMHPDDDWLGELITIDMNPLVKPDYVHNMDRGTMRWFSDETFDEIAAYDCLEHWGKQGDWKGFFDEFSEYHRLLKPGGRMGIIVPIGDAYFSDPGHVRFFHRNWFGFLNQGFYEQCGETAATDYRFYWKKNFDIEYLEELDNMLVVVLRKPEDVSYAI